MIKKTAKDVKNVLLRPKFFFREVKTSKNFKKHLLFLSIFSFFAFLFLTNYYMSQFNFIVNKVNEIIGQELYPELSFTIWFYLLMYFTFSILFILISSMRYWVTHIFVRLLGGKKAYRETFKAMVYSLAPEYISVPIFVFLVFMFPFTIFKNNISLWIIFLSLTLVFIVIRIYEVYLRVIALSILGKISKVRAFLAIYILGFIAQILLVGIIEIILIAVGFGLYIFFTSVF